MAFKSVTASKVLPTPSSVGPTPSSAANNHAFSKADCRLGHRSSPFRQRLAPLALALAATALLAAAPQPQTPASATTPSANPSAESPKSETDPVISIMGLGVKAEGYDQTLKHFQTERDEPGQRTSPAIDVMLHVATQKYDLVTIERAVVESLTDQTGRDLSLGMTQATERLFFPSDTTISLDHKHGFILLHFPTPPAGASQRLTMRGTVLARSGGKPQTLTFENVPFAKESKFSVLGHDYTLDNIYSYNSEPNELNFSFTSAGSFDEIRALRFLSADGKQLVGKIRRVDRNMLDPTKLLCGVIGERPQALRIEVDTYENITELAIPFQLTLDPGVMGAAEPAKTITTATLPAAGAPEKIKSQCQVLSLELMAPIDEKTSKQWFGDRASASFFRHPGSMMLVKVHVPDRKMIRLPSTAGTVLSFTTDTGESLLATARLLSNNDHDGFGGLAPISPDGHDALLTVFTTGLPSHGTRTLHFQGKIGAVMAESEKVGEAKGVSLLPGTTFNAGDVEMKVTSVEAAGAAGNGEYLTLTCTKPVHGTVVLLNENGKQLASASIAEGRFPRPTDGGGVSLTLAKAIDTATVQVRTTRDEDVEAIPVEFTVPIGLGEQK